MCMSKEKIKHYYRLKKKYVEKKSNVPYNDETCLLDNIEDYFSEQLKAFKYMDYHIRQEELSYIMSDILASEKREDYRKIQWLHIEISRLLEENKKDFKND